MSALRTVGEIGFGLLFAVGAVFNGAYTLTRGSEFYGSFAAGAFMPGARRLVEDVVVPNAALVTIVVVIFEATVAAMLLLRGDLVRPALVAGSAFALGAAYASNPGGAVANVALAAGMVALAASR